MRVRGILLCLFAISIVTHGLPSGAPYKSCGNLYPKHGGTDAQPTSTAPYTVQVSSSQYSPGDTLTVTLSGQNGATFRGFILVANRVEGDTEEIVGTFINTPSTLARNTFWYPSERSFENCVTHVDNSDKSEVILTWQSPVTQSLGDIVFRATFVQSHKTFWVDVRSEQISALVAAPPFDCEYCLEEYEEMTLDECGDTKGCVLFPNHCSGDACTYVITYTEVPSYGFRFEVKAKSDGYVTWAISDDMFMGEDNAVTCAINGDFVSVQYGFNPAYFNDQHRVTQLRNVSSKREDGYIYCSWTHPYNATLTHLQETADGPVLIPKSFDLNSPWHMFMAYGKLYAEAPVLGKHSEHPIITTSKISFTDYTIDQAESLPLEYKIHGMLGILAWIFCVGIAKVIARHFRERFERMVCGSKAWFRAHQILMGLTLLLTIALFVIIFRRLGRWTRNAEQHARVGVALMALVLVQVLIGILRPNPDARFRPVFNWVHRLSGHTAHILSAVAMFLVLYTPVMHRDLQYRLTIVYGVWVGIDVIFELLVFEVMSCVTKKSKNADVASADNITSSKAQFTLEEEGKLKSGSGAFEAFFAIYVLCLAAVAATAIGFIFIY